MATFTCASLLLVAVILISLSHVSSKVFVFQDCGDPATRYATIDRIDVQPDPLLFGQDVTVGATFTILKTIPEGSYLFLEMWRTVRVLRTYPIDVPFAPCTSNGICRIPLNVLIKQWRMGCDYVRSARNSSSCEIPLTPGRYDADGVKSFIPELKYVEHRIGAGVYKARVRLRDPSNREIACVNIFEEVYTPSQLYSSNLRI